MAQEIPTTPHGGTLETRQPVEELFTVGQVAKMSHKSKKSVYDCIRRKALVGRAPNGCERPILITRSDYESWVGLR